MQANYAIEPAPGGFNGRIRQGSWQASSKRPALRKRLRGNLLVVWQKGAVPQFTLGVSGTYISRHRTAMKSYSNPSQLHS